MRRTLGIDPEICDCGAKMMVVDVITEVETISEVMVSMGLATTPPPRGRKRALPGDVSYVFNDDD